MFELTLIKYEVFHKVVVVPARLHQGGRFPRAKKYGEGLTLSAFLGVDLVDDNVVVSRRLLALWLTAQHNEVLSNNLSLAFPRTVLGRPGICLDTSIDEEPVPLLQVLFIVQECRTRTTGSSYHCSKTRLSQSFFISI